MKAKKRKIYIGVREICCRFMVSRPTVYKIIKGNYIKSYRRGTAYSFDEDEVERFFSHFFRLWKEAKISRTEKHLYLRENGGGYYEFTPKTIDLLFKKD